MRYLGQFVRVVLSNLYFTSWPLLRELRDRSCSPALRGIAVSAGDQARVSAYVDGISIILSFCSDIEVVQKTFKLYEKNPSVSIRRAIRCLDGRHSSGVY